MTTLMVIDGMGQGETRSQAVVRRLREELARHHTSVAAVARALGEVQQKYSRKMTNQTPWDVDSLDRFCGAFGGDFNYVTTGVREIPTPPPGGGGERLLLPRVDSNHQPPDHQSPNLLARQSTKQHVRRVA
jgi:hypothetical protein